MPSRGRTSPAFTKATRAEPGCLWFDWSRSLDDPNEYVLVEAFPDGEAGGAHVLGALRGGAARPAAAPGRDAADRQPAWTDDWSELGELAVPEQG